MRGAPVGITTMKVLLVDDHALVREGITILIQQTNKDAEVLQARNVDEAVAHAESSPEIAMVLLDLGLPGKSGFEGLELLRVMLPDAPIIVVSASEDPGDVQAALDAGAAGYVVKSANGAALGHVSPLVMSSERVVPVPASYLAARGRSPLTRDLASDADAARRVESLTPRQKMVLAYLADGDSNKEIARKLGVIDGTIKAHVKSIMQKLQVHNRTQAAMMAARFGLDGMPEGDEPGAGSDKESAH